MHARLTKAPRAALSRLQPIAPGSHGLVLPDFHQAATGARSIFPSRVYAPSELARLLKDGFQSRKIGKTVQKGTRRGWPIFTLTLEERASCPRSCLEWSSCYGNNMHAAERIQHGPELIAALEPELTRLARIHPGGFLVRLHILGDLFSIAYVDFWRRMLARLPALHVFGFTAHAPSSPIGRAIAGAWADHDWGRWAIRYSGAPHALRAARVIGPAEQDGSAILCPTQTGATDCCATCALCWHSDRAIAFRRH